MLQTILAGVFMIFVVVVIHEAGHMVVARFFGVHVPVFSVGMGPRVAGFVWRGTDWRLSALPVGGYVQMAGADAFGEEDADETTPVEGSFMHKPVWQRLLIMAAGPVVNLIFPFVLFVGIMMLGEPAADTMVGGVSPGLAADQAGLQVGDRLVQAEGFELEAWDDFYYVLYQNDGNSLNIEIEREGELLTLVLPPDAVAEASVSEFGLYSLGLDHHRASSQVGVSDPASPAGKAGLMTWDAIRAVDGQPVMHWQELQDRLQEPVAHELSVQRLSTGEKGEAEVLSTHTVTLHPDPSWAPDPEDVESNRWGLARAELFVWSLVEDSAATRADLQVGDRLFAIDGDPLGSWNEVTHLTAKTVDDMGPEAKPRTLSLTVIREGEKFEVTFTPGLRRELVGAEVVFRPLMGIARSSNSFIQGGETRRYYSFGKALVRASDHWGAVLKATLKMLGNVVTGATSIKESVGGPVAIFQVASHALSVNVYYYVNLMAQISFSLGIINLLPVPVFDGGQIVFYSLEGLRGRPLPLELRERIQMIGVLALIGLMLLVTVVDVSRLFDG